MTYKKIYMTFIIKRHMHARVIFRWYSGTGRAPSRPPRTAAMANNTVVPSFTDGGALAPLRLSTDDPAGRGGCA